MGQGLRIGSLAGAPIYLAPSFALLAVVLGVVYAPGAVQQQVYGSAAWLLPVGYIVILVVSVLLHEFAHAIAGLLTGQRPLVIIVNVWGGQTQFESAHDSAGRSALIAAVGPATNLVLSALAFVASGLAPGPPSIAHELVMGAAVVNLLLGVMNLIPGLPLDGGQILEALVWAGTGRRYRGTYAAGWVARVLAVLVVLLAGAAVLTGYLTPFGLIWTMMMAVFLWQAASAGLRSAAVRRRADQLDLRQLVQAAVVVPPGATLSQVLDAVAHNVALDPHFVIVAGPTGPVGVLEPAQLLAVPQEQHPLVRVEQVATPQAPTDVIDLANSGGALLQRISGLSSPGLVAVDQGRIVGVIAGTALMTALTRARG